MAVKQIVFSPTGGTQKVADIITDAWGGAAQTVDLSDPRADFSGTAFAPEDVAVLSVPSFGGRVPAPAAERVVQLKGNGAKCVLVCVYGNRAYEDTLVEMEDLAEKAGFWVAAAVAAVAEHSIMHQYAAGRPDADDTRQLQDFAQRIRQKLDGADADAKVEGIPGNRPYKKSGGASMVPKPNGDCTACGLCAKKCPVGAISLTDPRKVDKDACIGCMRCVAVCPQHARSVNGAMVAAAALAMKKVCSVRKDPELYL